VPVLAFGEKWFKRFFCDLVINEATKAGKDLKPANIRKVSHHIRRDYLNVPYKQLPLREEVIANRIAKLIAHSWD